MTYTPLQNSKLWQFMEEKASLYPSLHASKLDYLFATLNVSGGSGFWHEGHLADVEDFRRIYEELEEKPYLGSYLTKHNFLAHANGASPAENSLFGFIPAIQPDAELGRLDLTQTSPALEIPLHADVHDLAATAMFLRHVWQNPQLLKDSPLITAAEKHTIAGKALNACFEIVEKRGLDEDFARSCSEFADSLPALAALTDARKQCMQDEKDLSDTNAAMQDCLKSGQFDQLPSLIEKHKAALEKYFGPLSGPAPKPPKP